MWRDATCCLHRPPDTCVRLSWATGPEKSSDGCSMQIIFSDKTIESANSENSEKMQNLLFYIIKFGAVCNTEISS